MPTAGQVSAALPPAERLARGPVAVLECFQRIPCDPCAASCPTGAVKPFAEINDLPALDVERCIGCAKCVAACPGLAVFVVDLSRPGEDGLVCLPYEFLPLPARGEAVRCLGRDGEEVCRGTVERVVRGRGGGTDAPTPLVWLRVPKQAALAVRHFEPGGESDQR